MLRSMYSGISGMKVNQTKLDVIGNNIANVSTTAFKGSRAEFKDMLYQNAGYASNPSTYKGGTNAKQVGLGAQLSSINKMMSQGNAMSTGRSLDVCIDGEGYLIVSGATQDAKLGVTNGALSGTNTGISDTLYSRDGNLCLDEKGDLLTADGYRVMGYYITGSEVKHDQDVANTDIKKGDAYISITANDLKTQADNPVAITTELRPLAIPDQLVVDGKADKVRTFNIGKDGLITVTLASGNKAVIGQIAQASFKNPEALQGVGGNLLQDGANTGSALIRSGKTSTTGTTTTDNSGGFGDFIQGALEASNVDLTEQFTDMIVATRAFQASSKMISNGDEILQTITGLVR